MGGNGEMKQIRDAKEKLLRNEKTLRPGGKKICENYQYHSDFEKFT